MHNYNLFNCYVIGHVLPLKLDPTSESIVTMDIDNIFYDTYIRQHDRKYYIPNGTNAYVAVRWDQNAGTSGVL